jgi:hypothetical protein
VFQKSYTGNILGIGRNEARSSYFPRHEAESKAETGGHATWWRGCTPGRATLWWGPWVPSDIAPPPIKSLQRENPKRISVYPDKVLQRRRRHRQSSGDRSLCFGTLPGREIAPRVISIDSTVIFIVIAISYDEEGVVLPRGRGFYQ